MRANLWCCRERREFIGRFHIGMCKLLQQGISDIRSAVEIYTIILAKVAGKYFYLENIPKYQSFKRSLQQIVFIILQTDQYLPQQRIKPGVSCMLNIAFSCRHISWIVMQVYEYAYIIKSTCIDIVFLSVTPYINCIATN